MSANKDSLKLPPVPPIPSSPKASLRDKLAYNYPYTEEIREKPYPGFVWQTWKRTPRDESFEDRFKKGAASWPEKHPEYVHEIITDDYAPRLIHHLYRRIPEVVEAYDTLPEPVLKADFFRYLILFARGGIYTDIDTKALKPAHDWVPESIPMDSQGLTVGIEADPDRPDWNDWYARRIQFCQWTIRAKPGHPALLETIARITETTRKLKKSNLLKVKSVSVMDWTGPAVWTDSLMAYFNTPEVITSFFGQIKTTKKVGVLQFTKLDEAIRVGDVVVLPITAFSPGQGHMGSKPLTDPGAMVAHDFDGSWKPKSERMKDD